MPDLDRYAAWWGSPVGASPRRVLMLAVACGTVATAAAAGALLGAFGAAVAVLPVALVSYSWATGDLATARERRDAAALAAATARAQAAALGRTAALVGLARERQAAVQTGAEALLRAALELALAPEAAAAAQAGPRVAGPGGSPG